MKVNRGHGALSFLFAMAFLNACATKAADETLEDRVQSWVGTRQDEIVTYWGEADETLEIGEGMRVLQYEAESEVDYPCVVIFSVNRYGFILGAKFNGDRASCQEFVKVIPEEERNMMMRTNLVILEAIGNIHSY